MWRRPLASPRRRPHLAAAPLKRSTAALDEPSPRAMGKSVPEIDLRDGRNTRPETAGVDAVLKGWLLADFPDAALEAHGIALFEGLYTALARVSSPTQ